MGWFTADDVPPGSKERIEVAGYSAGAACNPQDVVTDWGNYDEDYTDDEQASSWEHTDVDTPIEVEFVAANWLDRIFGGS
jgi:hypothetical protein